MRAIVLGSGAGGAFPQWNCGCPNCVAVRDGRPGFEARTQDSIAVTEDGERFLLVNASPDVLQQIQRTKALWPRAPRHSPIEAIALTNGDMDHVLGLFSLRENHPLALYVTRAVRKGLEQSAFLRTLQRFDGQLVIREIELDRWTPVADAAGEPLGITMRAFPTDGKLPVHFVGHAEASPEDSVGLTFRGDGGGSITYAAATASADPMPAGEVLLFDGTFYREDELVRLGLGKGRAKDMAHVPIETTLAVAGPRSGRKVFTHINNTNPILDPASEERAAVLAAGWEIAHDGMEIVST